MRNSVRMVVNNNARSKPHTILHIFWPASSHTYFIENRQRRGTRVRSHILEEENHLPAYNFLSQKQRKRFKPVKEMGFVPPDPTLLHSCLKCEQ
jgi:hypothetical protein